MNAILYLDHRRLDLSKFAEYLIELGLINVFGEVLNVDIGAGEFFPAVELFLVVLFFEHALADMQRLKGAHEELLTLVVGSVELIDGFFGILRFHKVYKPETFGRFGLLVLGNFATRDFSELDEKRLQFLFAVFLLFRKGFDVKVGDFLCPFLLRKELHDGELTAFEFLAVFPLYGGNGGLFLFEVDEAISHVLRHLDRQDISILLEGVKERLVVGFGRQVLDENVSLSRFSQPGVAVDPHHTARPSFDLGEVQSFQSLIRVFRLVIVDVSIAQRSLSVVVAAQPQRVNLAHSGEDLHKFALINLGVEVANIK
mmetsp:Transcript_2118/g.3875  ORF Transcript_2118/g.3875 Transcript_2118/m.3875 type:complete len:313 (-) Transcript_2118:169-1107(-)